MEFQSSKYYIENSLIILGRFSLTFFSQFQVDFMALLNVCARSHWDRTKYMVV